MKKFYSSNCQKCHQPFSSQTSQLFCDGKCYQAHRKAKTERICKCCGDTFYKTSQGHHGDPVYCSMTCQANGRSTTIEKLCARCQTPFGSKLSHRYRRRYCSKVCMDTDKFTRITVECLHCAKSFVVRLGRKNTVRFCSRFCKVHFNGETDIEVMTRKALQTMGIIFKQEYHLHPFYADFFLPLFNVAIEADGNYWHTGKERQAHDARRDAFLLARGIHTIRLPEAEIRSATNLPGLIAEKLHLRKAKRRY